MEHFGISVVIREEIGVEAESYEDAVEIVKEIWLDNHNLELVGHEIDPTGPKDLREVLDLLEQNGFKSASNLLQLYYNVEEQEHDT